jgi:hypothetical protein
MVTQPTKETVFVVLCCYSSVADRILGVFKTYVSAMEYARTIDGNVIVQEWNLR